MSQHMSNYEEAFKILDNLAQSKEHKEDELEKIQKL